MSREPNEASWTAEPETARIIEENWLFRLRKERFRSRQTGKAHDFFVIELPDAVNVIAITPERQVVLVRQFRAGSNKDSLEPPGGLVDKGEDPCIAGARELLEETGYTGDPPVVLGSCWANSSILNSRIITVLIENAKRVRAATPDEHEELGIELHDVHAIPQMIREGEVDHALAVLGLLLWMQG